MEYIEVNIRPQKSYASIGNITVLILIEHTSQFRMQTTGGLEF